MNVHLLPISGALTRCRRRPHDWAWFRANACVALPAALLAGVWCGAALALIGG